MLIFWISFVKIDILLLCFLLSTLRSFSNSLLYFSRRFVFWEDVLLEIEERVDDISVLTDMAGGGEVLVVLVTPSFLFSVYVPVATGQNGFSSCFLLFSL